MSTDALADRLRDFGTAQTGYRAQVLPDLLETVQTDAYAMWFGQQRKPGQAGFRPLAEAVARLPITNNAGAVVANWAGNFAVVEISLQGELVAVAANTTGPVCDEYGVNLSRYALMKALLGLHIEMADRLGGSAANEPNATYLHTVLGGRLYVGAWVDAEAGTVIAASGCEVPYQQRVDAWTPGASHADQRQRVNHLAGELDELFARTMVAVRNGAKECVQSPLLARLQLVH